MSCGEHETELAKLQVEPVKLLEWIKYTGQKVVIIFEGRDAAGKGGGDKDDYRMPQPSFLPHHCLGRADRKIEDPMVFPALCSTPPCIRRDGPL